MIQGRRMILERLSKMWNDATPQQVYPVLLPTIPQFRMTRRLQGLLELDESDDKRYFADAVGMTGDWRKRGPILYIPYRCLIGKRISNLITAGRCISVTTSAWDITRAIPTCSVTGEAAGTAAAITAAERMPFAAMEIHALQAQLKHQHVIIDEQYSTSREATPA